MPLPAFLLAGAAIAGLAGVGAGGYGAKKMKASKDMQKAAQARYNQKIKSLETKNVQTLKEMDKLGELELEIVSSFATFQSLIESIQNRPEFGDVGNSAVDLPKPKYDANEIKRVSTGAAVLIGGLGGAALGTAGGFAAAGATTAAVMALGTASTGTAIASLSGVAATNATLAALGGGALAAGGGGMALGSIVLGGATLGVGLLIGGLIFGIAGKSLSSKAEDAVRQEKNAERHIDRIITHLHNLGAYAAKYRVQMESINRIYQRHLGVLDEMINVRGKRNWNEFTAEEKKIIENCVLLVTVLYNMCNVQFVLREEGKNALNKVNSEGIDFMMQTSQAVLAENGFVLPSNGF